MALEIWTCVRNYIPHKLIIVSTYPCLIPSLNNDSKRSPRTPMYAINFMKNDNLMRFM